VSYYNIIPYNTPFYTHKEQQNNNRKNERKRRRRRKEKKGGPSFTSYGTRTVIMAGDVF
jgi:hypothetical protein